MSYSQYKTGNPYGNPQSAEGQTYDNPYGGPEQHELQNVPADHAAGATSNPYGPDPTQLSSTSAGANTNVLSQQDFLSRVSHVRNEIRSLTGDVQRIGQLHQLALGGADGSEAVAQRQLDSLVAATQLKNTSIRDQIRTLKNDVERTPINQSSAGLKKRQWEALNGDFQKELRGYIQEEQAYKERYREQIARQYRIVNPDASDDEVRQASERDWGDEGVFQTALRSNRSGQASAVLGNVRARHNELLAIEHSITELAQLIQDLDTMIIQQEPIVQATEEQTNHAITHMEEGNKQIDVANKHARNRRKLKWWCAGIVLLIILAIALGVGLGVGLAKSATSTTSRQ
ncbi:t-SNARE [Coniella lustricola]|uniref:t-SNARE n=1 Tax=Coniella lustricola TaxID=2025994 RepID=A0A2T3ACL9_9PEZI|nr:t-SNARE [Coniella lustricola]